MKIFTDLRTFYGPAKSAVLTLLVGFFGLLLTTNSLSAQQICPSDDEVLAKWTFDTRPVACEGQRLGQ
ncbi:MAG: hypothetical protein AAGA62_08135, partial [Bacteroidota bacterium]